MQAVVYDFAEGRDGEHARQFLTGWRGQLVCDDFKGYKALFANGVTDVGCLAQARRKFFDLLINRNSPVAEEALQFFGAIHDIERITQSLDVDQRSRLGAIKTRAMIDTFHAWLTLQRQRVTDGTAIARAIEYSLNRWVVLVHFVDDGNLPPDNNHIENRVRPIALGRSNWFFAGSPRGGQRAAAVMSLIQSAKLNGHDPDAYLKDVLGRLPTQPASRVEELLPHRWAAIIDAERPITRLSARCVRRTVTTYIHLRGDDEALHPEHDAKPGRDRPKGRFHAAQSARGR